MKRIMQKLHKRVMKKRSGMTIVETIVALFLMALAVIVMARLTSARIAESEHLGYQFEMRAADACMYDIYEKFHSCVDYEVAHDIDTGVTSLTFNMGTDGSYAWEFRPAEFKMYMNNAEQFRCAAFTAHGDSEKLYVSLKLENGQRLEYHIYA